MSFFGRTECFEQIRRSSMRNLGLGSVMHERRKTSVLQQGGGLSSPFAVNGEENGKLDKKSDRPRDRVGKIQALRSMVGGNLKNGVDPEDAKTADAQHGDDHG